VCDYTKLPEDIRGGMQRYVENGVRTGSFVTSVLRNDLAGSISSADPTNLKALPDIVRWVYNEAPGNCWGSVEKVKAWKGT